VIRIANKATGLSHQFGNLSASLKVRNFTLAQASPSPITAAAVKMEVSIMQ